MEHNESDRNQLRNNPVFVIGISCVVAFVVFFASFLSYYYSDTKRTIEELQATTLELRDSTSMADIESPDDIDAIEKSIKATIDTQNDETDFSAAELTDSALGL